VSDFDAARAEMVARRTELNRRLDHIEDDLRKHARLAEPTTDPALATSAGAFESPAGRVLQEFMATLQRELGQIESAIQRIDTREYDCCIQCGGRIQQGRLDRLPYAVNCESCSSQFPVEYLQQLRGRHSSLRRTIAALLGVTGAESREPEGDDDRRLGLGPLLALLSDLSRQLPERFDIEERDGYLSEALAAAPRFSRRATALMQQHAEFSLRIRSIVKEAESALESHEAWGDIRADFRDLCLDLIAHEQAEADIIESAFLDDMGASD